MNLQFAPDSASNFAGAHDAVFYTITALTVIFTLLVYAMVTLFLIRYRRGAVVDRSNPVDDNHFVEYLALGIPTLLGLAIFGWSAKVFVDMRTPPKDAQELFVVGKQWMWHIQHPNGIREQNEIHLELGKPIKVTMISQDVIHGFYIPEFRVQYHVVPGRYTQLWFTPTKVGEFHLFCTILCGTQHSEMGGKVFVMTPEDFSKWQSTGGNRFKDVPQTLAEYGKQTFKDFSCANCHEDVDTERGPSLYSLLGKNRTMNDGTTVSANEEYIRDSIINPYAKILKGYENTMPIYQYKSEINEEQIRGLIEYIKTMGQSAPATGSTTTERIGQ